MGVNVLHICRKGQTWVPLGFIGEIVALGSSAYGITVSTRAPSVIVSICTPQKGCVPADGQQSRVMSPSSNCKLTYVELLGCITSPSH